MDQGREAGRRSGQTSFPLPPSPSFLHEPTNAAMLLGNGERPSAGKQPRLMPMPEAIPMIPIRAMIDVWLPGHLAQVRGDQQRDSWEPMRCDSAERTRSSPEEDAPAGPVVCEPSKKAYRRLSGRGWWGCSQMARQFGASVGGIVITCVGISAESVVDGRPAHFTPYREISGRANYRQGWAPV